MKKKLVGFLTGVFLLVGAACGNCWWSKPRQLDKDLVKIYTHYEVVKITRIWICENTYMIFVDINGDDVEDTVLLFTSWAGRYCFEGERKPHAVLPKLKNYIRNHSI